MPTREGTPRLATPGIPSCASNACPGSQKSYYMVRSAGPDKQLRHRRRSGDLSGSSHGQGGGTAATAGTVDVEIEHDRGPFNGRAEDQRVGGRPVGRGDPGRHRHACAKSPPEAARTATANAAGQFTLSGLTAGRLRSRGVGAAGFQTASRKLTLKVRDRAVLSATLNVGSVTEAVVVEAPALAASVSGGGLRRLAWIRRARMADGGRCNDMHGPSQ